METYTDVDGVPTTLIDVPIYLPTGQPGEFPGTPIGVIRKGVEFLLANDSAEFVMALVALPAAPPPALTYSESQRGTSDAVRFVPDSLWVQLPKLSVPGKFEIPSDRELEQGFFRTLTLNPQGVAFSHVRCNPIFRLDDAGAKVRVAVQFAVGELWGWIDLSAPLGPRASVQHGWDPGCHGVVPYGAPANYQRPEELRFELKARMTPGDDFYFPASSENDLLVTCKHVQIAEYPGETGLFLRHFDKDGAPGSYVSIDFSGRSLLLQPHGYHDAGATLYAHSLGPRTLQVVGVDEDALGFVHVDLLGEAWDEQMLMFDPNAMEWWDRSVEKCMARLRQPNEPRKSKRFSPPQE